MKEIKYRDEYGFDNINTPELFDQLETQALLGSKNRFVYDFSSYVGPANQMALSGAGGAFLVGLWSGLPGTGRFITKNNTPLWQTTEVLTYAEAMAFHTQLYGNTGMLYEQRMATSETINIWPNQDVDNIGYNQDGTSVNYLLPRFNEDCIGFINEGTYGTYGNPSPANNVEYFRSGYIELSFKTTKKNMVLAYGSAKATAGSIKNAIVQTGEFVEYGVTDRSSVATLPSAIDFPNYYREEKDPYSVTTELKLNNGRLQLHHFDTKGDDAINLYFDGIQDLSDDKWHHVVINFGRPGIIKEHGTKYSEKYIEFWIDGKLDKKFYNENKKHNFYAVTKWILGNPNEVIANYLIDSPKAYNDYDRMSNAYSVHQDYIGSSAQYNSLQKGLNKGLPPGNELFAGTMRTFAVGVNIPLDKYEIQFRYNLWNSNSKVQDPVYSFNADAKLMNPVISVNKKRALKLFWNNINNENGIELDNNFIVDSYCVTHKLKNSPTEIFNYDIANKKDLQIKTNVKVALTDNVLIWGPGKISLGNTIEAMSLPAQDSVTARTQFHGAGRGQYDSITDLVSLKQTAGKSFVGPIADLMISGITLLNGERILLTNQIKSRENGIWIFNGLDSPLTRPDDFNSPETINNSIVYVEDGYFKNQYFYLANNIKHNDDIQIWYQTDINNIDNILINPIIDTYWTNNNGLIRFIDLEEDLNINDYDLILFMNYPKNNEEVKNNFIDESFFNMSKIYNDFLESLKTVIANGANLYVSSPKLAEDLGIVKKFTEVPQLLETTDAASSSLSPFELGELANRYFDTHRNNKYNVATLIPGLTDKETYLLTDFINFIPESEYDYDQYHAKYSYRQFGLQEGNEFIIPGSALRKVTENENLPGFRSNQLGTKPIMAVAPSDILAGTLVTKLANNYYNGSTATSNPYDDYATTIVIHNGQLLGGTPINGKIFMNCVEDGYTFSREEYNKAVVQVIPQNEINETVATRAWQYSTTRLNRLPQRINISNLTNNGQTTPTNGGGGAFIQAPSNASNGVIRSLTDKDNKDYQSDLYPTESEEIYPLQEIPVLSMTWLGLQWLAE